MKYTQQQLLDKELQGLADRVRKQVEYKYRLPKEPHKPGETEPVRKKTATEAAYDLIKDAIEAFMEFSIGYTQTEIQQGCYELEDLSNQRVAAILRQMVDEGTLVREDVNRRTYFSLS